MKLSGAKMLFQKLRKDPSKIVVRPHAYRDHPERKFKPLEIQELVLGRGRLIDNKMASALPGSFMRRCKDLDDRDCELVIVFEGSAPGELIVVVHAFRRVE